MRRDHPAGAILEALGVIGACLFYGDTVITPANLSPRPIAGGHGAFRV